MNVEPFLIADSVVLVVAQRLVRKICRKCGVPQKVTPRVLTDLGYTPEEAEGVTVLQGRGCELCNNTGYKGRTGLFEVMEVSPAIKEMILGRSQSKEIKKKALETGMISLRRSGLIKIKAGITSIEEVVRETVRD
jgi:type IV pilus assembly protein PilB